MYELAGPARTLFVEAALAWCAACKALVYAEHLPSVDELNARWSIHKLGIDAVREHFNVENLDDDLLAASMAARRRDLDVRLPWRRARQSPAKCLSCGSSDFTSFGPARGFGDGDQVSHPGCDGAFVLSRETTLRLHELPSYTPEGDRLY
ncbi:MAG: hypothetical protein KC731_39730 [Myxococcales bacterium]|nr:hypothetical protein [Myxococcales bacterium]